MNYCNGRTTTPYLQILTRDSVTVAVDAVVYYRVFDPLMSVINIVDASKSTHLLSQTTLRNDLGKKTLSEILTARDEITEHMQVIDYFRQTRYYYLLFAFSRCRRD